ncbi:hypothetical protein [Methanothermococcus okinawensis]|uniref:Uncharacterized protein n=1 Tax=Methanothermococcus okinawensis (strain DSM 14208 / JCM 11175 / IH1) TaxID=647113 RepID=F8ALR3_METOI|nr:hypothetical protein [Methanothermococcus okinawensis]AEH06618.1 hypothetical protein Metok_0639 [Methanothermococcus okinawensis IH1]
MKKIKIILLTCSVILAVSLCSCVDKQSSGHYNNDNYYNKYIFVNINNTTITVPLRTTLGEALSTQLINTTNKDIRNYYLSHKIIYLQYNESLPSDEGGVSIADLVFKLKALNQYYPHIIVDKNIFNNSTEAYMVKNSNKTMVINIIRGNRNATIEKYNNIYIIEGNSLKELDKAESRFVIILYGYHN